MRLGMPWGPPRRANPGDVECLALVTPAGMRQERDKAHTHERIVFRGSPVKWLRCRRKELGDYSQAVCAGAG